MTLKEKILDRKSKLVAEKNSLNLDRIKLSDLNNFREFFDISKEISLYDFLINELDWILKELENEN